jgi:hypothetical protein
MGVTTELNDIHKQIDELSELRGNLWRSLAGRRDPQVMDEIKRLDGNLQTLWDSHRAERARIRFGERDEIVRKARAEDRLDRAA